MVSIQQISVSEPAPFRFAAGTDVVEVGEAFRLRVLLANDSASTTSHIVACRRVTKFDRNTKVLLVGFTRDPTASTAPHHVMVPTLVALEPGEKRTLETDVELSLTRAELTNGRLRLATDDAHDWTRLHIQVTVAESPFRPVFGNSAGKIRDSLAAWGTNLEFEIARSEVAIFERCTA